MVGTLYEWLGTDISLCCGGWLRCVLFVGAACLPISANHVQICVNPALPRPTYSSVNSYNCHLAAKMCIRSCNSAEWCSAFNDRYWILSSTSCTQTSANTLIFLVTACSIGTHKSGKQTYDGIKTAALIKDHIWSTVKHQATVIHDFSIFLPHQLEKWFEGDLWIYWNTGILHTYTPKDAYLTTSDHGLELSKCHFWS